MLKRTILFCSLAIGLLLQACYYDNETVLYNVGGAGVSACDTTNVTYAGTIAPIMATSCNMCHVFSNGNGYITADYANLKLLVTSGKLVRDINWTSGADPMPKGGQKLSACVLTKIDVWIRKGALNN